MEDKKRRRIGIMGGTFNPVHVGHLLLAENAYSMFSLDEILFIPSGCPYMKDPNEILDGATRLRMTELSIRDNPHFFLSSMEIDRGGYTYTCQTLEQLEKENPDCDYFFIMGADSLFQMGDFFVHCPQLAQTLETPPTAGRASVLVCLCPPRYGAAG